MKEYIVDVCVKLNWQGYPGGSERSKLNIKRSEKKDIELNQELDDEGVGLSTISENGKEILLRFVE